MDQPAAKRGHFSRDHQRGGRGHSHGHHRHERGRGRGGGDRGHGRGRGRGRGAAGEVRTGRGGSWLDPSVTVPKPARTSLAYKLIQDSALTDTDAGIVAFVTDEGPSLDGVIKQRFEDFQVAELDSEGNLVVLTDNSEPPKTVIETDGTATELKAMIGEATFEKLVQLDASGNGDSEAVEIDSEQFDKDARKRVHELVRTVFAKVETTTAPTAQGVTMIKAVHNQTAEGRRLNQRSQRMFKQQTHFVLHKANMDTFGAIQEISRLLHRPSKLFGMAGAKDKRAVTTQRLSIAYVEPENLHAICPKLKSGIMIGNFAIKDQPISLGHLSGNRFRLVIRNCNADAAVIEKRLESLKSKGFVNYFGMQRFGTQSVPTHAVGLAMLSGDLAAAVDLILMPRKSLDSKKQRDYGFRETFETTRSPAHAYAKALPQFTIERSMFKMLAVAPNDYDRAINSLPRTSRMMYLHAYQSYIWNRMATFRLEKYGFEPVAGDLVIVPKRTAAAAGGEAAADEEDDADDDVMVLDADDAKQESASEVSEPVRLRILTEENAHLYDISQVVLPLPGYASMYPANEVGEEYGRALEKDRISLDSFRRFTQEYALKGAYRAIIARPAQVEHCLVRFDDVTQPLLVDDARRFSELSTPEERLAAAKGPLADSLCNVAPDGKYQALVLQFALPPSCYATMLLRELLRTSTDPQSQATLNSYLRKGAAGAADLEFEEDDEETAVAAALQDDEEPDAEE